MMHNIELRDKRRQEDRKGQPTVGANCEVLIDGQPLQGVRSFKVEVDAKGVAMATIVMYGNFAVDVIGDFEQQLYRIKSPGEDCEI